MQTREKERYKVSWHLRDLMKRDVQSVQDVCNWLEKNAVKPREIANRNVSKRMLARMIAAQIALKAARDGDVAAAREVMDRTEGKVADRLELSEKRSLTLHIDLGLGQGSPDNAVTSCQQVIEGMLVSDDTLDQVSSVGHHVEGQVGDPTPSTLRPNRKTGVGGE